MIKITADDYKIDKKYFLSRLRPVLKELKLKGDIVIKLGSREESRQLNSTYLNKDYATDVLSFPMHEELPDGFYVGDIFICYPIAQEQAGEQGIPFEREMINLMVHGILHLAGFDHETDGGEMAATQEKILNSIDIE